MAAFALGCLGQGVLAVLDCVFWLRVKFDAFLWFAHDIVEVLFLAVCFAAGTLAAKEEWRGQRERSAGAAADV